VSHGDFCQEPDADNDPQTQPSVEIFLSHMLVQTLEQDRRSKKDYIMHIESLTLLCISHFAGCGLASIRELLLRQDQSLDIVYDVCSFSNYKMFYRLMKDPG
jgi:hypothetical protein